MKNKKLFKSLTIGIGSVVAASIAVATPLVVMAVNHNLTATSKESISNGYVIKNGEGKEIGTTRQTIAHKSDRTFTVWKDGKWFDLSSKSIKFELSSELSEETCHVNAVAINEEDNIINGFVIAHEATATTEGSVTIKDGDTTLATINIKLDPTETQSCTVVWEGQNPGEPKKAKIGQSSSFTITNKDGQLIKTNPDDIRIGCLSGNKVQSVTYDDTEGKYNVVFGNTVGDDKIFVCVPGYTDVSADVTVDVDGDNLIGTNLDSNIFNIGSKQIKLLTAFKGNNGAPLTNCTFRSIYDCHSIITTGKPNGLKNYYTITAGENTDEMEKQAAVILECPGFGSIQLNITVTPSTVETGYTNPLYVEVAVGATSGEVSYIDSATATEITEGVSATESSGGSIATVAETAEGSGKFKITGVAVGECKVTLYNPSGAQAECYVRVTNEHTLTPSVSTVTIKEGATSGKITFTDEEGNPLEEGAIIEDPKPLIDDGVVTVSRTDNEFTITGVKAGTEQLLFSCADYNDTVILVTVQEGADFSLDAPKETAHGTYSNEIVLNFTPHKASLAGEFDNNWEATIEGTTPVVAEVKSCTLQNIGSADAYVQVILNAKTISGSGMVNVSYTGEKAAKGSKGSAYFYVHSTDVTLTAPSPTPSLTAATQTLVVTGGTSATDFNWVSSDETIATVDENGVVTYHSSSKDPVTITARLKADTWSFAQVQITVKDPELKLKDGETELKSGQKLGPYKVTDEEVGYKQLTLVDGSKTLTTDSHVIWSSSDTDVASVDANDGKINFKGVGTATITATYRTDTGVEFSQSVIIELVPYVYKFVGSESQEFHTAAHGDVPYYKVSQYKSPIQLQMTKDDAAYTAFTSWVFKTEVLDDTGAVIEGTPVISITNGVVSLTGGVGKVLITATPDDSKAAVFYAAYEVTQSSFSLQWNESAGQHLSDSSDKLDVLLDSEPISADDYTVTWATSDSTKIDINATTGILTYYIPGEANAVTITATITNKTTSVQSTASMEIYCLVDDIAPELDPVEGTKGGSLTQTIRVNDKAAPAGSTIEYYSDNTNIFTVDKTTGVMNFIEEGSTTMHIDYVARTGAQKQSVNDIQVNVTLSGISLNYTWVEGTAGNDSVKLKAYDGSTEITDYTKLQFKSGNTQVATVSSESGSEGQIHLVGVDGSTKGYAETTITVLYKASSKYIQRTCNVKVYENRLSLSTNSINAKTGDDGIQLTAYYDGKALTTGVTWTSDDSDVATVANGKLTYVGKGVANITAKYGDYSAICKVTLTDSTFSIDVPSAIRGITTKTRQINCYVDGVFKALDSQQKICGKQVLFSSNKTEVCTVTSTGLITFVAVGTATITVYWGGEKVATIEVTILK